MERLIKIEAYTDGSADHLGRGGWAVLLRYNQIEKLISGAEEQTTNNRMELRAALEALKALTKPCKITVFTDSQYLQKAFTDGWLAKWQRNGWKTASKESVKNQDLWMSLLEQIGQHEVDWGWVKGHAGHAENEQVDQEAQRQRKTLI